VGINNPKDGSWRKRLKTAVIGTGFMGRVHLEALQRVEFVDVIAVAGRELGPAQKLAAGFGVAATDDYRKLLQDSTLDAVHICTPNVTHYQMAKDALQAGKHVLCEKPVTISVEEAQELVALARKTGLRNGVCHNLRYYPMVQQMRRMREAGELRRDTVPRAPISRRVLPLPSYGASVGPLGNSEGCGIRHFADLSCAPVRPTPVLPQQRWSPASRTVHVSLPAMRP